MPFNAVIEGTYHDEWMRLNYKIAELQIPEGTQGINDGNFRYVNFEKRPERPESGLETKVESLDFLGGIVLPFQGGAFPQILERPRAVVLRDFRVFVEQGMLEDQRYVTMLPNIIMNAGRLFNDERIAKIYEQVLTAQRT
mgnify:CR=1 FL=1